MVTSESLLEMSEISLNMDQNNNRSPVKKPELSRKKRKPLMEKRRRARINASLEQLKKLVLDATRRDSARYSKLEKADILELTVRHLRDTQRNNINYAMHQDPSVLTKFGDGFGECVGEVNRYLSTIDGLPTEVRSRLMGHLSSCVQKVYAVSSNPARLPDFAAAPPLTPPHTGGPPPPLPFVLNQQGIPVFQHNIPVGMMSPPPTPTATPIRGLPGHNAHMSPPNSPTGNIQDRIMHQSSNIVTDSKRPHSESSQPKSLNSYAGQEMFSRPLPHVAGRHFFGDKVMYDHIPIKQEPREHLLMRGEHGSVLLREHARFVESMQMLKDSVWRPW